MWKWSINLKSWPKRKLTVRTLLALNTERERERDRSYSTTTNSERVRKKLVQVYRFLDKWNWNKEKMRNCSGWLFFCCCCCCWTKSSSNPHSTQLLPFLPPFSTPIQKKLKTIKTIIITVNKLVQALPRTTR